MTRPLNSVVYNQKGTPLGLLDIYTEDYINGHLEDGSSVCFKNGRWELGR